MAGANMTTHISSRIILHADMDAFFASVEQAQNPHYRNLPVIVGGLAGRGVVSAASYEAREFGVHSAMPMWRARQLCPHAVFLPPNVKLYKRYSDLALDIYLQHTPCVEAVSIDEAYLDITGTERLFGSPLQLAERIKRTISARLDIGISIGLGGNRLLAKLASDWDKPDGLMWLRDDLLPDILDDLPVEKLHGIGEMTRRRLSHLGVSRVGQLRGIPLLLLEKEFGKSGLHLYQAARGEGSDKVAEYDGRRSYKQLSEELTLQRDSRDVEHLRLRLLAMAGNLARRLRNQQSRARTVTLKVRFSDFKTITRSVTFPQATDNYRMLYEAADELLRKTHFGAQRARLIGLAAGNLRDGSGVAQLNLFDDTPQRSCQLDRACDRIIERFGTCAITPASLMNRCRTDAVWR